MQTAEVEITMMDPDLYLDEFREIYRRAYQQLPRYGYRKDQEIVAYLHWLKKRAGGEFVVPLVGEKPVGFMAVDSNWLTWTGRCLGEIHEIVIAPDYQGGGIGRQLFQAGLDVLRRSGHKKFELWVGEKNDHARAFYESLGFHCKGKWGRWIQMIREEN